MAWFFRRLFVCWDAAVSKVLNVARNIHGAAAHLSQGQHQKWVLASPHIHILSLFGNFFQKDMNEIFDLPMPTPMSMMLSSRIFYVDTLFCLNECDLNKIVVVCQSVTEVRSNNFVKDVEIYLVNSLLGCPRHTLCDTPFFPREVSSEELC